MSKKKKSKIAIRREKLRTLVHSTKLFEGWTPEKLMKNIKEAVVHIESSDAKIILQKCFHPLIQKPKGMQWSQGYCHCIAQVAEIVLHSAGRKSEVFSVTDGKKKVCGRSVPQKHRGHFVLKLADGHYFDPEAEMKGQVGFQEYYYSRRGYGKFRLLSQWWYPSNKAIRLLKVFINYCCENRIFSEPEKVKAERLLNDMIAINDPSINTL